MARVNHVRGGLPAEVVDGGIGHIGTYPRAIVVAGLGDAVAQAAGVLQDLVVAHMLVKPRLRYLPAFRQWHEDGSGVDETIEALTNVLAVLAYQRENVKKAETPELNFEDEDDE